MTMIKLNTFSLKSNAPLFKTILVALYISVLSSCGGGSSSKSSNTNDGPTKESVGKSLFFDTNLSSNKNQSCSTCHDPEHGFADPDVSDIAPVSEGSVAGRFGNRNAPTVAYASFIPIFKSNVTVTADGTASNFEGGQFLDGRRNSLKAQAKDPFLNPVEMNNADKSAVVTQVQKASYANDFKTLYGTTVFEDVDIAYDNIADAIAAFEKSPEVNPFDSKFDLVMSGDALFNASEQRGFDLFKGGKAKCSECHTVKEADEKTIFTDFRYFNIGTPINAHNPSGNVFPDNGLGSSERTPVVANASNEIGKFRTPTLRNVALTAPYMHNGAYKTLKEVITHYDVTVANFELGFSLYSPEVATNIAKELKLGSLMGLGLSQDDYDDLENFMNTLSDGFKP